MGCRILSSIHGEACFYCSTSMTPFWRILEQGSLESFQEHLEEDPRGMTYQELDDAFESFKKQNGSGGEGK